MGALHSRSRLKLQAALNNSAFQVKNSHTFHFSHLPFFFIVFFLLFLFHCFLFFFRFVFAFFNFFLSSFNFFSEFFLDFFPGFVCFCCCLATIVAVMSIAVAVEFSPISPVRTVAIEFASMANGNEFNASCFSCTSTLGDV